MRRDVGIQGLLRTSPFKIARSPHFPETYWLEMHLAQYVSIDGSARACGVGDSPRRVPTQSDFRETSGPRIDRIPSTRPPWWRRQYRELKKLIFSAPSKRPIDLFGPVANGTILKRLRDAMVCMLVCFRPLGRTLARSRDRRYRCLLV